jgi:hypothetical protein
LPPYRRHISLGVFVTDSLVSLSKLAQLREICLRMNLSMTQIDISNKHKHFTDTVQSSQTNLTISIS